jgi:hypothetical protein
MSTKPHPFDFAISQRVKSQKPSEYEFHPNSSSKMSFNRPLPAHLRHPSTSLGQNSTGQSPALLARINEKKAELANLKDLQALSAALADQMQMLEDKLSTLADGTEGALFHPKRGKLSGF